MQFDLPDHSPNSNYVARFGQSHRVPPAEDPDFPPSAIFLLYLFKKRKTPMKNMTAIDLLNDKRNHLKTIIDANVPYEALQLIALHIEFMGKLLDRLDSKITATWASNRNEHSFENVCSQLSSMKKYNPSLLQDQLRNGLVHNGVPKENLLLTHHAPQSLDESGKVILNINTLYADFSTACDELIAKLEKYDNDYPNSLMTESKFPHLSVGGINEFV